MRRAPPPDALDRTHDVLRRGDVTLFVHRAWREAFALEAVAGGAPITAWGRLVEHDLRGRGAVHVLVTPRGDIVAKSLSRGGIIGALAREWYLDPGRLARQAVVAEALRARGVATPPVVLARATRIGPGRHRLELATARVDGAEDLLVVLRRGLEDAVAVVPAVRAAGATLRRLHDAGLRHRDLQVKNLLVPGAAARPSGLSGQPDGRSPARDGARGGGSDELVVIDLDRCELGGALPDGERVLSLARFGRSLAKHGLLPRAPGEALSPVARAGVAAFFSGYAPGGGPGERSALCRRVARRLGRDLRLHRHLWPAAASRQPSTRPRT